MREELQTRHSAHFATRSVCSCLRPLHEEELQRQFPNQLWLCLADF